MLSMMTISPPPPPSSPSSTAIQPPSTSQLPIRPIPGSYGWPLLGPISDRLDYFWFQGPETFFRKRIEKHKSTVFRTNLPPTFPFFTNVNPSMIAVLDVKSFSHLFDMEIVEKKDVLVGDFMPSVKFTGDMRVGIYLDTSEPKHAKAKAFAMDILKRSSDVWVRELITNLDKMWDTVDCEISKNGEYSYLFPLQRCIFNFLTTSLTGVDPAAASPEIAADGYSMLNKWLALQVLPTVSIGVLQPLEEIFLHSFAYPFFLVAGDYRKLENFIGEQAGELLERGKEEFGLTREETIHNLLFVLGFNAYGGFSVFLPSLIGIIAGDESGLQEKIRAEVRSVVGSASDISFRAVDKMELVKSIVYETLRLKPPVALQFARARKDFRLTSHESVHEIKKGELLCGYQPLVMRDPNVFDKPEAFKPERFMGQTGSQLLDYLYWSNGPQTGTPSESNKQCAGKDHVTLSACMVVAYLFQRYDKISGDSSKITAVEKAK